MTQSLDVPILAVISPDDFSYYAYNHVDVWPSIIGCRINHIDYGLGKIIKLDAPANTEFLVKFDQPINGKYTHYFSILQMDRSQFDKLWIPIDLFEAILDSKGSPTTHRIRRLDQPLNKPVVQVSKPITDDSMRPRKEPVVHGSKPITKDSAPPALQQPIIRIGVRQYSTSAKTTGEHLSIANALNVKCPYCFEFFPGTEIKNQIHVVHESQRSTKSEKSRKAMDIIGDAPKNETQASDQSNYYPCPYCKASVKKKKFIGILGKSIQIRHFRKNLNRQYRHRARTRINNPSLTKNEFTGTLAG